jgi:hypothetical protein
MAFRITAIDSIGADPRIYIQIGDRDALMDDEYDRGALGVSVVPA